MALKLLVDECLEDKLFVAKLRAAGHDVKTAKELGLTSKKDDVVFGIAIAEDRLVITINCADFVALTTEPAAVSAGYPGVLLVYRHNVAVKEMSHDNIIKAISNLESIGHPLANGCHKLNDYDY